MPIRFCSGDIFATPIDVALAHGCNCAGAMGKGIAVEFKRRWPDMFETYRAKCDSEDFTVGEVFQWRDGNSGRTIFNLGTQSSWRTKATLDAIEAATTKMLRQASESNVLAIAMPMIGAGLGGLDAKDVKEVLVRVASDTPIEWIVCEEFSAGKAPE